MTSLVRRWTTDFKAVPLSLSASLFLLLSICFPMPFGAIFHSSTRCSRSFSLFPMTWVPTQTLTCIHLHHLPCSCLNFPAHFLTCNSFHHQPLTYRYSFVPSPDYQIPVTSVSASGTMSPVPVHAFLTSVFDLLPIYWTLDFCQPLIGFVWLCWTGFWFWPSPATFTL